MATKVKRVKVVKAGATSKKAVTPEQDDGLYSLAESIVERLEQYMGMTEDMVVNLARSLTERAESNPSYQGINVAAELKQRVEETIRKSRVSSIEQIIDEAFR